MSKIKISFDIEDIWEEWGSVRDVMRDISLNTEDFDLYIITKSTNTDLIDSIQNYLGLDSSKIHIVASNSNMTAMLSSLGIQIHLTKDYEYVVTLENTTTQGICVNSIQDAYDIQPKWFKTLGFWINQINKANGSTQSC